MQDLQESISLRQLWFCYQLRSQYAIEGELHTIEKGPVDVIIAEDRTVYIVICQEKKHYWHFTPDAHQKNIGWVFDHNLTLDDIIEFGLRMKNFRVNDAKSLCVKPVTRNEFLASYGQEVNNAFSFCWEINNNFLLISHTHDYQRVREDFLSQDKLPAFEMVLGSPEKLFYDQYAAFNNIPISIYQRMLSVDSTFRRRYLKLETKKEGIAVTVKQNDYAIKSLSVIEGAVSSTYRTCAQNFFPSRSYVFYLEGNCLHVEFYQPVGFRNIASLGTLQGAHILRYEDAVKQLNTEERVYLSEYVVSKSYVEGNHAMTLADVRDTRDNSREPRSAVRLNSLKDIYLLAREAWYKPQEDSLLKPSGVTVKRQSVVKQALLAVLLFAFLIFEILAGLCKWRISVGVFHNVAVWLLGVYAFLTISAAVIISLYSYKVWMRYTDYQVNAIKLSDLQTKTCGAGAVNTSEVFDLQMQSIGGYSI